MGEDSSIDLLSLVAILQPVGDDQRIGSIWQNNQLEPQYLNTLELANDRSLLLNEDTLNPQFE